MTDIDKMLLGTSWTRAKGKHGPLTGIIDNINERGPRIKAGSQRLRISWAELDFSWMPTDNRSGKAYDLWKLANETEYLTKQIESETKVTNGSAPIMTTPEVGVKECHGAWHRHSGKKGGPARYDLVALSEFDAIAKGPKTGQLKAICRECDRKQNLSPSHRKDQSKADSKRLSPPSPVKIEPGVITETGITYRWQVTVVQPTVHIVQAKDFLDAAAQVASLGEVTKVEKL